MWEKNKPKGIFEPTKSEFKGYPILSLPIGPDGDPFSFGIAKAKAILMFLPAIRRFVDDHNS
jgi:hypothetical protein